jgi:GNAT superfamily N-acetyltransferase
VPESVVLRPARPEDAEAISGLIMSLARFFLADPDHPERAAAFFPTISPAGIAEKLASDRHRYHVAEVDGALAGIVGMRDGRHLAHLFVAEPFRGRGIATLLWETVRREARAQGNPGEFTLNSTRYAAPLYERFGFRATSAVRVADGIAFIPMQLVEAE